MVGLALGVGGLTGAGAPDAVGVVGIIEPTAGLQVTVTRYLRACVEVSYRVTPCFSCPAGLTTAQGSGVALGLGLRFGSFGR